MTDYSCSDWLDLISFTAQMFGFHSFLSLRIFVIAFPPGVIPVLGKESEKQPLSLQDLRGTFLTEKEGKKMGKSFLRYLKCELL